MTVGDDPVRTLRERLTALDESIVSAFNERLELVERLRRVKEERGLDFLDPAREQWLRRHLVDVSSGPLTREGVEELVTELLALTKRELER